MRNTCIEITRFPFVKQKGRKNRFKVKRFEVILFYAANLYFSYIFTKTLNTASGG